MAVTLGQGTPSLAALARRLVPSPIRRWLKATRRAYLRTTRAFSPSDLQKALARIGVHRGDLLLVHSSFDSFLAFRGTPQDVIRALQDAVGPEGTLMMPTLPFDGSVVEYAAQAPVFDVRRTASRMGLISEVFRRSSGVTRSLHPTHSVAAWGKDAREMVAGHHLIGTPCGRGSPYGKLLDNDGKILFVGVPVATMTFFHALEEELASRMPFPVFAPEECVLNVRDEHGEATVSRVRLFAIELAGHRDLTPLVRELKRGGLWDEATVGRVRLILLRARAVYAGAVRLAEAGVFCYDF